MTTSSIEEKGTTTSDDDAITLEDFLRSPRPDNTNNTSKNNKQQFWQEKDRAMQETEIKRSRSHSKESFQTANTNKSKEEIQNDRILERSRAILQKEHERSKEEVDFLTFIAESGKKPLSVLLTELEKEEKEAVLAAKMDSVAKNKSRRQTNFARFLPIRKIAFVDNRGSRVLSPLKSSNNQQSTSNNNTLVIKTEAVT
jgi:hypothetical protein